MEMLSRAAVLSPPAAHAWVSATDGVQVFPTALQAVAAVLPLWTVVPAFTHTPTVTLAVPMMMLLLIVLATQFALSLMFSIPSRGSSIWSWLSGIADRGTLNRVATLPLLFSSVFSSGVASFLGAGSSSLSFRLETYRTKRKQALPFHSLTVSLLTVNHMGSLLTGNHMVGSREVMSLPLSLSTPTFSRRMASLTDKLLKRHPTPTLNLRTRTAKFQSLSNTLLRWCLHFRCLAFPRCFAFHQNHSFSLPCIRKLLCLSISSTNQFLFDCLNELKDCAHESYSAHQPTVS